MPKYLHGKQNNIISFQEVKQKVIDTNLSISEEAYFWLLYYCGVRKSEAYERVVNDLKLTETHFIIDFHKRKKHGAEVEPLALPRRWYGVNKIVEVAVRAAKRKPRNKTLFQYSKDQVTKVVKKDYWLFPKIGSTKAWQIVKKVLGEKYYPHFLRLNRLTEIGSDPTANLTRLKDFSGIKSVKSLSAYLGVSQKERKAALDFMDQQQS